LYRELTVEEDNDDYSMLVDFRDISINLRSAKVSLSINNKDPLIYAANVTSGKYNIAQFNVKTKLIKSANTRDDIRNRRNLFKFIDTIGRNDIV
jgi:hypothetical protein